MAKRVAGYRALEVWKQSMTLVELTFEAAARLPATQRFALTSQMQRAAISIPSNIAEGYAKRSTKDYVRHLKIAAGSLAELETQLELTVRLELISRDDIRRSWNLSQDIGRMLNAMIVRLTNRTKSPRPSA